MRACSVETCAARAWSSQKPGSFISVSSSPRRAVSAAGSKVITDPREAGPDLLQTFGEAAVRLGHPEDASEGGRRSPRGCPLPSRADANAQARRAGAVGLNGESDRRVD